MNIPEFDEIVEPNDQTEARKEHLEKLRELVGNVYPNKFNRSRITGAEDTITRIVSFAEITRLLPHLAEGEKTAPEVKEQINAELKKIGTVRIAGRLATPLRVMGKVVFVHLSDGISRLQIYARRDEAQAVRNDADGTRISGWEVIKLLDHGDFIGVEGFLFITNTGELSVHVEKLQFLSKAMLPMPDKMHGIADPELRRRYRYADLIADSLKIDHEVDELTTREVFERRAKLISGMRNYLDAHGFIEVETPILTPKATGAAAEPFETYHKALDIKLYARIAPELYLKRLTVGGFEKVYELNRNFRNEGLSHKHSPEFTMLEFYCAYMDVNGMMDFAEAMIKEAVQKANNGSLQVKYGENEIDFSDFRKWTMKKAIAKFWNEGAVAQKTKEIIDENWLNNDKNVKDLFEMSDYWNGVFFREKPKVEEEENQQEIIAEKFALEIEAKWINLRQNESREKTDKSETAKNLVVLFDTFVELKLKNPTFITDYPKSISPLSKASPENPNIAERFELFINGMECANGFSELNDPQEQYERFLDQMREREGGDEEAMILDEDYIRALSYGMPPAAGIGIGIDRLVMLLTNRHSIRDVILFPHMRPLSKTDAEERNE